jgi:hypothetical protein
VRVALRHGMNRVDLTPRITAFLIGISDVRGVGEISLVYR